MDDDMTAEERMEANLSHAITAKCASLARACGAIAELLASFDYNADALADTWHRVKLIDSDLCVVWSELEAALDDYADTLAAEAAVEYLDAEGVEPDAEPDTSLDCFADELAAEDTVDYLDAEGVEDGGQEHDAC